MQDNRRLQASVGVERFLGLLEAGRALPPDPREAGTTREDAAAFVARMHKIVARYEAQHLKRSEWQVGSVKASHPPLALSVNLTNKKPLLMACICFVLQKDDNDHLYWMIAAALNQGAARLGAALQLLSAC